MLSSGQQLGAYLLEARIGAGGMGEVWKAEDTRLGRAVAIKILPPAVAADADAINRMKREARTAAQLYHPNIATIHSIEQDGEVLFIVMELAAGESLKSLIGGRPLPEADVCRIGRAVADALAEAHEKGIVHRDIKPENIVVNGHRVKVLDFGIAKRVGAEVTPNTPTTFVTQQGMIVGTVYYMSPEQALGKPIDARSDLFSLGVVLYEAATGRMPFGGDTITETITRIIRDEAEEPRRVNPAISAGLNAIIAKCMRKNRDERFASAEELSAALDRQLAAVTTARSAALVAPTEPYPAPAAPTLIVPPPRRRLVWPWVVGTLVLLMTMALAALMTIVPDPVVEKPKPAAAAVASPPPTTTTITVTEEPADAEPTIAEPEAQPAPAPAPAPPTPERTADEAYNEGLARLVDGRRMEARAGFSEALRVDADYAKAHFRLGELDLLTGSREEAREHFNAAMENSDGLDEREQKLVHLGLAILDGDRFRAHAIARELRESNPRDPDVMALQRPLNALGGPGGRRRGWRP
ncbi:MAG TPA: serine/threonine-protein kinase [Thermoanaerobaculia bacterium]|jgi:tetratricopeptide (TPR) repeat protein|nr:serine/threonine-protein kinase [Thermoanaerobaculia bacterium]